MMMMKMCKSIRHTICESLVKIQYFRHEYSSIMDENTQKTTGKPIKWIICFSPVLSKVFLQKNFTKNHGICRKLKKIVLGPAVYNPPRGKTSKTKI